MMETSTTPRRSGLRPAQGPVPAPGPLRWALYAYGAALPARYRDWVLHDLTTRTWQLRQLARGLVQVLPAAMLVVLVVPGDLWVRTMAVLGGVVIGMIYAAAYVYETTEHRALKAGFPRGTLQAVRDAAHAQEREAAAQRYALRHRTPRA
ncbi:DUF5313 family protein [Pseudonocardia sp.]|uniref:DUF5313 family protein n=1 Tax=Pseudonocardia sp. TaxID=60912 RepID=UPI003D139A5E